MGDVITAVVGFVGVLVAAWLTWWTQRRLARRDQRRLAYVDLLHAADEIDRRIQRLSDPHLEEGSGLDGFDLGQAVVGVMAEYERARRVVYLVGGAQVSERAAALNVAYSADLYALLGDSKRRAGVIDSNSAHAELFGAMCAELQARRERGSYEAHPWERALGLT